MAADAPGAEAQRKLAATLRERLGWDNLTPHEAVPVAQLDLRPPRVEVPASLAHLSSTDARDRAQHSYGRSFRDVARAHAGHFEHPPDAVLRPTGQNDVAAVLDWATSADVAVIPYGGGSSVCGGVEPSLGDPDRSVVSLDLEAMGGLLELDVADRAAHLGAGTYGPAVNDALRPHGLTLRHFPQSFEFSTVGGWVATRAGGHFATGPTHIDDFVESITMETPSGAWQSRRLPGSGAGPSPDRLVLGSEGTLGVICDVWLRVQARPTFRASASVGFAQMSEATAALRALTQSGLQPANCRLLDPVETLMAGAELPPGATALLIVGFESADHPLGGAMARAVELCRDHGGLVDDEAVSVRHQPLESDVVPGERTGAEEAWRSSFLRAPYRRDAVIALGVVIETFETACLWSRFEPTDAAIRSGVEAAMVEAGLEGVVSMRVTHAYPDGLAPYYTVMARPSGSVPGSARDRVRQWDLVKAASMEAIAASGATATHHHAVGRDHRPAYDRQRPELFAAACGAAKARLDPAGVMNPGVLLDG
ncbi:MAG: FAD-binding oxidoreductase [Microthrixaceae bacterium]